MKKITIYILLSFLFCNIYGQYMQTIDCDNGLSNRRVFQITKDRNNFMWFATRTGFDRFDGKNIRHYHLEDNRNSRIFGLTTSESGLIWGFASQGNIYCYDEYKDKYILKLNLCNLFSTDDFFIYKLYSDKQNRLWICTSNGLLCYRNNINKVTVFPEFKNISVFEFNETGKDEFLVTTEKGMEIRKFGADATRFTCLYKFPKTGIYGQIRSSYYDAQKEEIWLGSFSGELYVFKPKTKSLRTVSLAGNKYAIRSVKADRNNNIILGIDGGGVVLLDKDTRRIVSVMTENEDINNDLNSRNVYDIYCDSDGKIWIGTYNRGISIYNPHTMNVNMVQHEKMNSQSLMHNYVNSILEDKDGDMWYAHNKGITVYHTRAQKWQHYLTHNGDNNSIMSLCEDNSGNIWAVGFTAGAYCIGKKSGNIRHYNTSTTGNRLTTNDITSVYCDRDNQIWLGQFKGDLIRINPKTDAYTALNLPFANTFAEKDAQTLFVGTRNGLYQVNRINNKVEKVSVKMQVEGSLKNSYINALYLDRNGKLWIGTEGGLSCYDIPANQISNVKGLENYTVCGILEDNFSQLWISTHQGIIRMDTKTSRTYKFGTADGFISEDFNTGAYHKKDNGNMVFGSPIGAIEFTPESAVTHSSKPQIFFDRLHLFNKLVHAGEKQSPLEKPINRSEEIRLKYNQNTFSISFVNINYDNPDKWLYSWKLEGFDREYSQPTKQPTLSYSNLNPGKYSLSVHVFNENDPSINETRQIVITVLPPFWRSVYAYIFYFILGGIVIYMLYVYFTNRMAERTSKERIRFFIDTAHNIRTPITLIKAPLSELEQQEYLTPEGKQFLELALRNVDKLNTQINQLIDFQRAESHALKLTVEKLDIGKYMRRKIQSFETLAAQKNIEITLSETNIVSEVWFDAQKMDGITENLISNAIKYSPENGRIDITTYMDDCRWGFSITDNGIGIPANARKNLFKRYYRADNAVNTTETGSGLGLMIAQSLANLLHGKISFRSEEGKGSTFFLHFKNGNEHFLPEEIMEDNYRENTVTEERGINEESLILPELLLVEDNPEMCDYLKISLSGQYRIFTAHNGIEALELLKTRHPQIILSDIMMPLMRGDELCKRLKSDISYCHIPIILITALDEKSNIIAGYEAGAEDYILKPFDIGILKVKIESILRNRTHQQEAFAQNIQEEQPVEYNNSMDNEFMQKAEKVIDHYLSDSNFSINTFCSELSMSRTSVYNKLKALTGLSPNDYIKIVRLKRAAALLKQKRYYVNEVAYLTGFPDVKYFSVAFKKQFGITPKKYGNDPNKEHENEN